MGLIKEELLEIRERYGDERRTEITHSEDEIDIEDLIADQQMVISITHSGYIKSLPLATYRQQKRGGVGVTGHGHEGRGLHRAPLRVLDARLPPVLHEPRQGLPRRRSTSCPRRRAPRRAARSSTCCRCARASACRPSWPRATSPRASTSSSRRKKGQIKKTEFMAYNTPIKADGIIAIKIRDDDELVAVRRTSGDDDIIMVSRSGQAARFNEDQVRPMGRDTGGVRGHERRRAATTACSRWTSRGPTRSCSSSPRTATASARAIADYPVKGRGTMGVKTIGLTEKKGGAGRRADRARAPRARVHLAERDGPAHERQGHLEAGPARPGRASDEPARRRRGERGGARDGVRRGHLGARCEAEDRPRRSTDAARRRSPDEPAAEEPEAEE